MFAYSRYFISYSQFCLTESKKTKGAEVYLTTYFIENISIRSVYI